MRAADKLANSLALDMSAEDQLAQTANTFFSANQEEPLLKQEDQTEASFGIVRKARRFSQEPTNQQEFFDNQLGSSDTHSIIVGGNES